MSDTDSSIRRLSAYLARTSDAAIQSASGTLSDEATREAERTAAAAASAATAALAAHTARTDNPHSTTAAQVGAEAALGNPGTSGFVLSSTTAGARSWVAQSGGVTSVSGTAPIVSSGGATPAISIGAATTGAAGSMSATDKAKADAYPAISGLTTGQALRATAAGAVGYGAIDLSNANAVANALPVANGGTGVSSAPMFSVHKNGAAQSSIAASTYTVVTWPYEEADTAGCFASNRFTPNVAGWYWLGVSIYWPGSLTDQCRLIVMITSNSGEIKHAEFRGSGTGGISTGLAALCYANGSTTYFEIQVYQVTSGNQTIDGQPYGTYWTGYRIPA